MFPLTVRNARLALVAATAQVLHNDLAVLSAWSAEHCEDEDRAKGRRYTEVMDTWKTSCPRLPIWEEASARGPLARDRDANGTEWVRLTPSGENFLRQRQGA